MKSNFLAILVDPIKDATSTYKPCHRKLADED